MAKAKLRYRTVFVSDLHLGSGGCRAAELASFLKRLDCDRLYLIGDVIDMWRLRQRWYWPSKHNRVIDRLLKLARKGTRVVYIPGNHDEHVRRYAGLHFGGVEIALHAEHRTADGRRLFITHGDQFDLVVKHARLLSMLGGWAYDVLVVMNSRVNWVRERLGLRYWSLARFLKMKVKGAVNYIAKFEEALIAEAQRKGFDGVVCGHIHKAEIRRAGETLGDGEPVAGIDYFNCGDWVESCTALVEHADGTMELIDGIAAVERLKAAKRARVEAGRSPVVEQPAAPLAAVHSPSPDDGPVASDPGGRRAGAEPGPGVGLQAPPSAPSRSSGSSLRPPRDRLSSSASGET